MLHITDNSICKKTIETHYRVTELTAIMVFRYDKEELGNNLGMPSLGLQRILEVASDSCASDLIGQLLLDSALPSWASTNLNRSFLDQIYFTLSY